MCPKHEPERRQDDDVFNDLTHTSKVIKHPDYNELFLVAIEKFFASGDDIVFTEPSGDEFSLRAELSAFFNQVGKEYRELSKKDSSILSDEQLENDEMLLDRFADTFLNFQLKLFATIPNNLSKHEKQMFLDLFNPNDSSISNRLASFREHSLPEICDN
jgi:hypothetical protein